MHPSSANNPTEVVEGVRIGKQGKLRVGCSAVLFDAARRAVLLTRRTDNGQWCLPGGIIEPGESVAEGCEREVFEETGLRIRVVRLIGVDSNPNRLIVYPDGNKDSIIVLVFEVELIRGELCLSDETIDAQYIAVAEAVNMDLFHGHAEQIRDAMVGKAAAIIR